jgi:hypothetical protein
MPVPTKLWTLAELAKDEKSSAENCQSFYTPFVNRMVYDTLHE